MVTNHSFGMKRIFFVNLISMVKCMKKKKLKKNTFMQGAFIATFGIVISKIIGMIYVIPFYSIIGDKGGALYGYAYSVYSIFLGISSAGIPLAISKIISEYNALGYYDAKERAFRLGKKVLNVVGIICFVLLIIFAPAFATLIIKDVTGGNTIEEVTFVIRMISTAILVVPVLSIYRGYLQGHKFIAPTSVSQVLEQIVRVAIILAGSFLSMKVFHLSLDTTVGIAVFSATVGAFVSYVYLLYKTKTNRSELQKRTLKVEEPPISNKEILKKIFYYAFPFIMIDVFKSLYNSIDVVMLVSVLVKGLGYTATDAETIMSVISTWGLKINMIVIAIATGITVSLIPNISSSFVKKDMKTVNEKINQSLQMLLYLVVPMTVGLSILAKPVWTIFYGPSQYGPSVYSFYVFVALATTLFTITITTVQLMKEYRQVFRCLICGFLTNVVLNIPLLYAFDSIGLPAYFGSTLSTILGYLVCSFMCLHFLHKKYHIDYEETIRRVFDILIAAVVMAIVLLVLRIFLPFDTTSRLVSIGLVALFVLVGGGIYFAITMKNGLMQKIYGGNIFTIIKKKVGIH